MSRPDKVSEYLKYTFDDGEIRRLSYDLARDTRELRSLNESKKEVMADFAGKIKHKEGSCDRLSENVANGYEYRMVECEIEYDSPETGTKTLVRIDTGESWTAGMSKSEKQGELFEDGK